MNTNGTDHGNAAPQKHSYVIILFIRKAEIACVHNIFKFNSYTHFWSFIPMTICCCTPDEEKQIFGCILLHYQCGCFPCKMCDYDNDGMCWGCVCCTCQIDPCWLNRKILRLCCSCLPCGCVGRETVECICCCNPGKESQDPAAAAEAAGKK